MLLNLLAACLPQAEVVEPAPDEPARPAWIVEPLDVPAGETARCPSLCGDGARVHASWIEAAPGGGHRLRYARLDADEPEPETVATGANWFVNWADTPIVGSGRPPIVTWLERLGEGTYAYGVRWSRRLEDGRWSEPSWLHDDRSPTEHGFPSLARWERGTAAFWLDGRALSSAGHEDGAHGHGAMALRLATLDRGGRRGDEHVLDERVCECCPTSAVGLGERVAVAYRDRSDDEVRDVVVLHGDPDRPDSFVRSAFRDFDGDGWTIAGCPVNGPALAARGARVALAWYTGAGERSRVRVALSDDSAATFAAPFDVSLGNAIGRAELAFVGPDRLLVVWAEFLPDEGPSWMARPIDAEGRAGAPFRIGAALGDRRAGYAALASRGGEAVLLWTDGASPVGGVLGARIRPAR